MASSERTAARGHACWRCAVTLALAGLAVACSSSVAHDAAPVTTAAEAFLADQRAGAWAAAYGRLHAGMQQRCGSWHRLREAVEAAGELPESWTLRPPDVRRYTALLTGELRRRDGAASALELAFDRVDDGWVITAWSTGNRELCP